MVKLQPSYTTEKNQMSLFQSVEEFNLPKNIYVPEKFPYAWKWSTEERRNR